VRVRHRRVRQALADRRLDIQTHFAGRFFRGLQGARVGNAHAVRKLGFHAVQAHLLFDLRSRAVHQNDLDAHGLQQRDIGHERIQEPLMHHFAAETDDERLVTERMDVRGD
jgi:hypothetical protein